MKRLLGVLATAAFAVGMTGLTAQATEDDKLPGGAQPVTVEIDGTCEAVTVKFTNPNKYGPFSADIKGVEATVSWKDEVSSVVVEQGPLAGQKFGLRHTKAEGEDSYVIPKGVATTPGEATFDFEFEPYSGEHTIKARVARGPEQHSLVDWVKHTVDCGEDEGGDEGGGDEGGGDEDGDAGGDEGGTEEGDEHGTEEGGGDEGGTEEGGDDGTETGTEEGGDAGGKDDGADQGDDKGKEDGDDKGGDAGGKDDGTDKGDDKGVGGDDGKGDDDGEALPDTGAGVTMGLVFGILALLAGGYALLMRSRRNAQSMIG